MIFYVQIEIGCHTNATIHESAKADAVRTTACVHATKG